MEIYTIFGIISWILIVVALVIFANATFRFAKGSDCSKVFFSILAALLFMAIPYTMFIIRDREIILYFHTEISYLIYLFMIIVAIFFLKAAKNLEEFSKRYSFNISDRRRK
ncbi:MAG: hypothetical protein PHU12_01135 [Candidatus Aenigmarchaeota archaeon]|nr:hypothetical protein [Candidatus Aenigmarchaeota archaeon]